MAGLSQMFDETFAQPILAWDAKNECEVFVRAYIVWISADNPMHAEHCSSTGVKSNQFCRTCHAGGPQAVRQTEEGFSNLMQPGTFRTPDETINVIHAQFETAITSIAPTRLTAAQRAVGVKDSISQPILESIQERGAELSQANANGTTLSPVEVADILCYELK
ncbi:hypothetical protein BDV93DRAFT_510639 [Ceratobasidium sp. AG-I]|nr:hypothetical protein BDV93DRAFT_510639 [Ceratobasidium sp. AG-I]